MNRVRSATVLCALLALASGAAAQAQSETATRSAVAGLVRDTTGRPLSNVTVFSEGRDATTVTDSAGRFHLAVPSGKNDITVMRLGYRVVHVEAEIAPDTTVVLTITMRALDAQPMAPVAVFRSSWTA